MGDLRTIQRSRGVGEPPLFMGSAVFFAIRDALKAARSQWGVEEVLQLQSPATPEHIRVSCADPIVARSRVVPSEGEKSFFCRNMNFLGFLFRHAVSNTISKPNECVFHKS